MSSAEMASTMVSESLLTLRMSATNLPLERLVEADG